MTSHFATWRIASFALICAAASLSLTGRPPQKPKPKPPAAQSADDPMVIDQQGYRDILARYRGKPLLVNFWATWCEPCREEYPMINDLARQYAPQGLIVVGISLDDDGEITLVRHFLARNKPVFPNYRKRPGSEEVFINAVNPKWSGAIPAVFAYDAQGQLRGEIIGEASRQELEALAGRALRAPPARGAVPR